MSIVKMQQNSENAFEKCEQTTFALPNGTTIFPSLYQFISNDVSCGSTDPEQRSRTVVPSIPVIFRTTRFVSNNGATKSHLGNIHIALQNFLKKPDCKEHPSWNYK